MNILRSIFLTPALCFASINFVHINKTAGTTMRALLKEQFDERDFYPYTKPGILWETMCTRKGQVWEQTPMDQILKILPAIDHKIAMGHFPVWFLQRKDPNYYSSSFNFTILREPLDLVLSHFFYMEKLMHPIGNPVESPLDIPPNHMCYMLCSDNSLEGEALLESAIENLKKMNFIIFQDDFEGGVRRLFQKLGIDLKGNVPRMNETARWREFDETTIQKILEINSLDVRLYEYANRYLRDKNSL